MGRPSSDLQHPDLGFDYCNLVDINSIAAAVVAAAAADAASLGEDLVPPQGRILFGTLQFLKFRAALPP